MTPDLPQNTLNIVIMAKPALPGKVKTRLIGDLTAQQATYVHQAMLDCILQRAPRLIPVQSILVPMVNCILALDTQNADLEDYETLAQKALSDCRAGEVSPNEHTWHKVDQGPGDLGERIGRIWQMLSEGTTVILGADCPDVPGTRLASILPGLQEADVAVGPVEDGGYWTLASNHLPKALLTGINWGSEKVMQQTVEAANGAKLQLGLLAGWFDVDTLDGLKALSNRLAKHLPGAVIDPYLAQLAGQIQSVL